MEFASKPPQKAGSLTLPVELRRRIYDYIQDPQTSRVFDWGDCVTISAPCLVEYSAIALIKTCKQTRGEVLDHLGANKAYHINIFNTAHRSSHGRNPRFTEARVQDLPLLSNTMSIRMDLMLDMNADWNIQMSLAEEVLVGMKSSTRLQEARIGFDFSADPHDEFRDAKKLNVEIGKLRMRVMGEGRKCGKGVKEMEIEFGLNAIERLKGMEAFS